MVFMRQIQAPLQATQFLYSLLLAVPLIFAGCGGGTDPIGAGDGGPDGGADGGSGGDGGTGGIQCVPDGPECNNCIDDDGDGKIDGFDVECVSSLDNDESSFATGIPGDNRDFKKQDCFFDGDSGQGNDDCSIDGCCLTDTCAMGTDCSVTQECIDTCGGITPPGCDCFGCCTVCNDDTCVDILLKATCDGASLTDPDKCPTCTKITSCGPSSCNDDPNDCVLCPGQSEDDLPGSCTGQECPSGLDACPDGACQPGYFCANGCCILEVE